MKKITSLILFILAGLLLVACQSTPDEVVVVGKDTERMIEKAKQSDEGQSSILKLGLSEEPLLYQANELNGKLQISVDAQIVLPDVEALPIVQVYQGVFTQDQVTGMFNYLFPDEKPIIDAGQVETKTDVELSILELKRKYANGDYQGSSEEYAAELASLEEIYLNAPETAPNGNISDGTLLRRSGDDWLSLNVHDDEYRFSVNTFSSKTPDLSKSMSSSLGVLTYTCKNEKRYYSNRNAAPIDDGSDLSEAALQNLTIPYIDAVNLCDGFFKAAGFAEGTFCVDAAYTIDNTGADEVPGSNYAYRFLYTRNVESISVYSPERAGSGWQEDSYAIPWNYEYIEFVVDNNGIVSIKWYDPVIIGDIVTEQSNLLPFDSIMNVFTEIIRANYSVVVQDIFDGQITLSIETDEIVLALLRIREQGGNGTDGLLVPAWLFYGYSYGTDSEKEIRYINKTASELLNSRSNDGAFVEGGKPMDMLEQFYTFSDQRGQHNLLLAINAIDGSIIDLSKGY